MVYNNFVVLLCIFQGNVLLNCAYVCFQVLCACDLKRRQPMFGEVDTVCLIVDIEVTEAGERWQFFPNVWNDILKKKKTILEILM